MFGRRISGTNKWRYSKPAGVEPLDMYQSEHNEMFTALRAGQPINNAEQAATSTLLAIMGRMAAYTGESITWEKAMNSQDTLTPPTFDWSAGPDRPILIPGPPVPGVTKFS